MLKKLKIIVNLLIVIFVIAIIVLVIISRKRKAETPPPIKSPSFTQNFQGKPKIIFDIKNEDFNFPNKIPVLLKTDNKLDLVFLNQIAGNLGFSDKPIDTTDVENGKVLIWSNNSLSLVYTEKLNSLEYTHNTTSLPPINNLNEEEKIKVSKDFLINKMGFSDKDIAFLKIGYLKLNPQSEGFAEETVDKKNTLISEIAFTYANSGYEIVSFTTEPLIIIRLTNNNAIYQAKIVYLNNVEKSQYEYPLKSFEDIKSHIDEASVVSIGNIYKRLADFQKNDITEIAINKISLAYYLENASSSDPLKPLFIMEGMAKSDTYPQDLSVTLYLYAIKSP